MGTPAPDPMLSYAQNGEDVVLARAFRDVEEGFYVDVGAGAPLDDNVTLHFYERGWHGVNVEPDPEDFERLAAARTRDVNLRVAVGPASETVAFYPSAVRGHGTLDAEAARVRGETESVEVPQVELAQIFDRYAPAAGVEFLKVDVEGSEAAVLASADWSRHRPKVVLVEAVDPDGRLSHESWEPALLAGGYRFALFDGINRFYCRAEEAETLLPLFGAPVNVLDNWRHAREVDVQDRLQEALALTESRRAETHARLVEADAQLAEAEARVAGERTARREAERSVDALRHELEGEQQAHGETDRLLATVYDSTSWRITSPVRDASRLVRMLRRGGDG
jgi:FkbM family methyltransferase